MKIEYVLPEGNGLVEEQITSPLLCRDCEQRLKQRGESEVIRHIAPKAVKKLFPLHDHLGAQKTKENFRELKRYDEHAVGLDTDKFANFRLSLVGRGAVHGLPKRKEA